MLQLNFTQGDVKPVVFQNVTASSGAAITSATYTETNHQTGAVIGSPNQPATVVGTTISTSNITWGTVGSFLVLLSVTYADGSVDHSIGCYVNVAPLPT